LTFFFFGFSSKILAARNWPYAGIKGFFDDFFDYLGPDFETKATLGAFPKLPEKCGSFTITFWIKPIVPDKV
jgi:hypothetical protein